MHEKRFEGNIERLRAPKGWNGCRLNVSRSFA